MISILVFSVVLKLVLFPFGIKQQKNYQKQASLRPKENVIRKKYAGRTDRSTQLKMNEEIQKLYQEENFSPFAGCFPMLLQMLVLLAVYAVVRMPLTYTSGIPKDTVNQVQATVAEMVYEEDADRKEAERKIQTILKIDAKHDDAKFEEALEKDAYQYNSEIIVINYINDHRDAFSKAYDARLAEEEGEDVYSSEQVLDKLPNLEIFKGFDLGSNPSFDVLKEKDFGAKLLILIPILSLVTSYLGQAITRKFTYQPEQTEEMKGQMKMMNIFMPLFSLYIAFQVPAAVGIYWVMSNVLSPVQQIALSKLFPIKEITPEEMREAERIYGGKQKKKKGNTATVGKKKSLVYDDDDEYESISKVPDKKVLKEKNETDDKKIIDKAPLKDDNKD
ncbi:MAG: YidC/Oxa1 family membrane protein insertase [Clostridia bacterium]|nr:YidC/Oxa1 family membrane protein insertase [Clostridia bacterium]